MKSVLVYNDLWGYVASTIVKPENAEQATAWITKDEKALALIVLDVSKTEIDHIRKQTTSKGVWEELEKIYKSQGLVRKAVLYRELYQSRKKPDQSMAQFANDFQQRADMLADVGMVVPQELLSIMLLSCLPEEYENFRVAIEFRDDIPEVRKAKLIEEEARRRNSNESSAALYSRNSDKYKKENHEKQNTQIKFSGKCFKCGKTGHCASVCRSKVLPSKTKCANTSEKPENEAEDVLIAIAMSYQAEKEE